MTRFHIIPGLSAWLCILALATPAAAATSAPVTGTWLDESQRAGITIAPCGEKLCGTITWLKAPLDANGKPKLDVHNSDETKTNRPLCGLPMLGGFAPDGNNAWSGGFIYDPEKGKSYTSTMHLQPDGTLRVRGFIGIELFGRSQTWTRPPAPLTPCR